MRILLSLLLLTATCTVSLSAQSFSATTGRNHPQLRWLEAETEHFRIIYPAHLAGIEAEAAPIAEETYRSLAELLGVEFDYKIPVYLSDQDEIVNGFAVPFDRNYTQIWVRLNESTVFAGNEKWLRKVLAHELAHIFHFRAVRGNAGLLSNLPSMRRHWTEGFAQYATEKWDAARGDALLRAAVFEDRTAFNRGESIKDGGLTYAVGNSQLRYFAQVYGDSTIGNLFAHRDTLLGLVRYHNFTSAFKAVTGKPYAEFDADWRRVANIHYNTLAGQWGHTDSLGTDPLRLPGTFLTDVKFSPDTTRIAVSGYVNDELPFHRIWIIDTRPKGRTRVVYEGPATGALEWSPDGTRIAFHRDRRGPNGSMIPDVYVLDVAKGRSRRLTTDLRATWPTWSPEGTHLFAATNDRGTADIIRIDVGTGAHTRVTSHTGDVQVAQLRHHPTGPWLAFHRFEADGARHLVVLNTTTRTETAFGDPTHDNRLPVWSPRGDSLAYTSLRDWVPNVFVVPFTDGTVGAEARVTDQFTGFTAWQWPDSTLVGKTSDSKLRDRAWRIPAGLRRAEPNTLPQSWWNGWTTRTRPGMIAWSIPADASLIQTIHPYTPAREIDHVVTVPIGYFNTINDWGVGGFTWWREPLGIHEILAGASISPVRFDQQSNVQISYLNRSFHPTLGVDLYHNLYESRVYSDDFLISDRTGARATAALPLDWSDHPFVQTGVGASVGVVRLRPDRETWNLPLQDNLAVPVDGTVIESELSFTRSRNKPYANGFVHPLDGIGFRLALKGGHGDAAYWQPDAQAYALLPLLGSSRLYLFGRYTRRFGTALPQEILGFNRYDEPDLGDYVIFNFGRSSTERVRGYRQYATGDMLLFGTAEWRIPLAPTLATQVLGLVSLGRTTAALFADAGVVHGVTNIPGTRTEQRSGAGIELKNELNVLGLSIVQSLGAARPTDRLDRIAATDWYWRIRATVPF